MTQNTCCWTATPGAPDITVRSTFIAGFPTETEENHRELLAFIREGWCDYAGFFPFSPEEGTKAETMKPRVSKRVAKKWAKELEIAQSQATVAAQQKKVGTVTEVLYEGIDYDRRMFFGRTEHEAPDVDTNVYFTADFPLEIGRVYKVYIEKADFHLYGVAKE